ncbi:MAG: hypothetical protein A2075_12805 [Geobacteraceae bacterium GWC2_58_44]|nr:MAG: hypothetical protein A2075_12805 [Geobacteraceae bacterium GWC2_58_44]HBG05615.1 hypothetical protein [Geobacter sp.]
MYIWYVTLYEPLPIGGEQVRPMRSGLLAEAIVDAGHRFELWLPGFEHVHHEHFQQESVVEILSDRYHIQYLSGCGYSHDTSIKRLVHNHQIAREFKRLAYNRSDCPDLIITQIPSLELAEAVSTFARKASIPVIVDIRDLWPDVYKRLFPNWALFLYELIFFNEIKRAKKILRDATAITAVSRSFLDWGIARSSRAQTKHDKVFHIGYPATSINSNLGDEISVLEDKYGFARKKVTIFFAGTFCSSYDLDTVFESAKMLLESEVFDIHIIIAGGGDKEDIIRKKSEGLANVTFVGWLDAVELNAFLSFSSVGLAPYADGALMSLPNKPFEYMAASLPVLNCLKGELEDLIAEEDCGKYYQAGNANALTEAMIFFLENPELTKIMGINGRAAIERCYDSKMIYSKFAIYLEEIVNDFRRPKTERDRTFRPPPLDSKRV